MDKYFRYEDVKNYICSFYLGNECDCDNSNGCKKLDKLPFADVAPVIHAHWIWLGKYSDGYNWRCSACRRESTVAINYCPFCGAKMDESEDK